MATLALSTLIKIGLAVVTGTSIIVPIVLTQRSNVSTSLSLPAPSVNSPSQEIVDSRLSNSSENTESLSSPLKLSDSFTSSEQQDVLPSETVSSSSLDLVSPVQITKDGEKKCFVIPAITDSNTKLLTCLKKGDLVESDEYEEYENSYYLYDSSKSDSLLKVEGSLMWNPSNKQITARLKKVSSPKMSGQNDGTFVVTGNDWSGISKNETDLLKGCAIFGKDSKDSVSPTFLLTCEEDVEEMSSDEPKGIPLTPWQPNS